MGAVLSYCEPVANPDRVTGEQRRHGRIPGRFLSRMHSPLLPPDQQLADHVRVETGLLDMGSRGQCFWMTVVPSDIRRCEQVLVFFHGAGEHIGCHYQNELLTYAHLHGVACIGFDMVGHGRSDGLHMMVESWDSFVDWAVTFCDVFVSEQVRATVMAWIPARAAVSVMGVVGLDTCTCCSVLWAWIPALAAISSC